MSTLLLLAERERRALLDENRRLREERDSLWEALEGSTPINVPGAIKCHRDGCKRPACALTGGRWYCLRHLKERAERLEIDLERVAEFVYERERSRVHSLAWPDLLDDDPVRLRYLAEIRAALAREFPTTN